MTQDYYILYYCVACLLGNCSYWYDRHPFPALCNPLGVSIVMRCTTFVPVNSSAELRWYWTPEEEDAGMCGTLITGEEDKYNIQYPTGVIEPYTGLIGDLKVLDFNLQDIGYYWCQIEDCDIHLASSRVGYFSNNSEAACSSTTAQLLESSLCAELPSPTAVSCVSSTYTAPPSSCMPTPTASSTASLHMTLTTPSSHPVQDTPNVSFTSTGGAVPSVPGQPQQQSFWLFVYIGAGVGAGVCCLLVWTVFLFCVVCCCAFHRKRNRSHVQKKQHHEEMT